MIVELLACNLLYYLASFFLITLFLSSSILIFLSLELVRTFFWLFDFDFPSFLTFDYLVSTLGACFNFFLSSFFMIFFLGTFVLSIFLVRSYLVLSNFSWLLSKYVGSVTWWWLLVWYECFTFYLPIRNKCI